MSRLDHRPASNLGPGDYGEVTTHSCAAAYGRHAASIAGAVDHRDGAAKDPIDRDTRGRVAYALQSPPGDTAQDKCTKQGCGTEHPTASNAAGSSSICDTYDASSPCHSLAPYSYRSLSIPY